MPAAAALRSRTHRRASGTGVVTRTELARAGIGAHGIDAHVDAGRWRRIGPAVILHNGPLAENQRRRVALINCGPRAVLTSFTAGQAHGLRGREREDVHVLAPAGTADPCLPGVRLHRVGRWERVDLGRLCRRRGLPQPTRQAVRRDARGRRRYLDAQWRLLDGSFVAAEVDGAHHLSPGQWADDQLRQNDIVIGGTLVLRYPSVVIRDGPELVAAQLRAVLLGRRRS